MCRSRIRRCRTHQIEHLMVVYLQRQPFSWRIASISDGVNSLIQLFMAAFSAPTVSVIGNWHAKRSASNKAKGFAATARFAVENWTMAAYSAVLRRIISASHSAILRQNNQVVRKRKRIAIQHGKPSLQAQQTPNAKRASHSPEVRSPFSIQIPVPLHPDGDTGRRWRNVAVHCHKIWPVAA